MSSDDLLALIHRCMEVRRRRKNAASLKDISSVASVGRLLTAGCKVHKSKLRGISVLVPKILEHEDLV
jgi:hypothetical protein